MKKFVFAVTTLLATMGAAQAQTSPLRGVAGLGISAGGDDLATAQYTNGNTQKIKAGNGVYFTVGADYRLNEQFSVQGTFNFHVDDTTANNGSIKFQRFPIEVLGYYHVSQDWRIGGGLRYVMDPKLSSSGVASGIDVKFDNTTSAVAEVEYFWTPKIGMKMRYVKETFKAQGYHDVKANHFGISGNYYF
jgi:opacity protein-like surface antigen